jgi:Aldo/keto reductase family
LERVRARSSPSIARSRRKQLRLKMTTKEAPTASHELSADGRARRLYDGNWMPMLGFGVWLIRDGRECEDAVRWALEVGCRHIDTARAYGNQESVGRALRDTGIAREEVFVTTKFAPAAADPAAELERSLNRLGLDDVDLYLVHWPAGGPTWAWPGMQRAQQSGGHARSASRTSGTTICARCWSRPRSLPPPIAADATPRLRRPRQLAQHPHQQPAPVGELLQAWAPRRASPYVDQQRSPGGRSSRCRESPLPMRRPPRRRTGGDVAAPSESSPLHAGRGRRRRDDANETVCRGIS